MSFINLEELGGGEGSQQANYELSTQEVLSSDSNVEEEVSWHDEQEAAVEEVEELADGQTDEDDRIAYGQLQSMINRSELVWPVQSKILKFCECDSPFRLDAEDEAKLDNVVETIEDSYIPWNIGGCRNKDTRGAVDYPKRRLNSELDEVWKYTPFFARNNLVFELYGLEANLSAWTEFLDTDQAAFVDTMSIDDMGGQLFSRYATYLMEFPMPPVIKDIMIDLLERVRYAYGKHMLSFARNRVQPLQFAMFTHHQCALEWRPIPIGYAVQHTCVCCDFPECTVIGRAVDFCCYCANEDVLGTNGGWEPPFQDSVREDVECIRIIQRLYMPAREDPIFLSPDRFSSGDLKHGLLIELNTTWYDLFSSLEHMRKLSIMAEHSHVMKMIISMLLYAEFYNRGTSKCLFPWKQFKLSELIPGGIYDEVMVDRLYQLKDEVLSTFQGNLRPDIRNKIRLMEMDAFRGCIVRSVSDSCENNELFECDLCGVGCNSSSVVVFDCINPGSMVQVSEEFDVALERGVMTRDFCTKAVEVNGHDVQQHLLSGECCEYHMTRSLIKLEWDTQSFRRVCWKCVSNKGNFLFLSRASLDGDGVDFGTNRQAHAGAWWFDMNKLLFKFEQSNVKRASNCAQC